MINTIQTALSGIQTATQNMSDSAKNIARAGTDTGSDVNFAEEAVNIKLSETAFKANLETIKIADALTEELLSTFDERV